MNKKYGVTSLRKQFPTDQACVEFLFDTLHSRECSCGGTYSLMSNGLKKDGMTPRLMRTFQCSKCRNKISPTAGTIFHKSDTPLTLWFHAIMVFSNAKSGISAKQMQRDLEVTYKTAYRMLMLIKKALKQDKDRLSGDVEMDTGFFGGKGNGGKNNENIGNVMRNKGIVFAAVERGGRMKAEVMPDATAKSHKDFLMKNVSVTGTRLLTDSANRYDKIAVGYDRHMVDHHRKEYVRGDIHVNNVETFWAHVKRSIKGTHKVVSKQFLQAYLDGFVWQYNARTCSDAERFGRLLGAVLQPARQL